MGAIVYSQLEKRLQGLQSILWNMKSLSTAIIVGVVEIGSTCLTLICKISKIGWEQDMILLHCHGYWVQMYGYRIARSEV